MWIKIHQILFKQTYNCLSCTIEIERGVSVIQRTVQLAAKILTIGTFDISIKTAGQKELCVREQVKLAKKITQALQWIVNIFIIFWQWLALGGFMWYWLKVVFKASWYKVNNIVKQNVLTWHCVTTSFANSTKLNNPT